MSSKPLLTRRRVLGASALTVGAALLPWPAAAAPAKAERVILVTIDTIRADHLPFHGYPRNTAPFLTELAERSVVFDRAICSSSHTNPSHLSILSGLQPPQHKLYTNIEDRFSPDIRLFSQMFQEQGMATGACCSVRWLKVFDRGFGHFSYYERPWTSADEGAPYYEAEITVDRALAWIEQLPEDAPFFLWLHLFDPHLPLRPPEAHLAAMRSQGDARTRLLKHWREAQFKGLEPWQGDEQAFADEHDAYDAEIHYVDAQLRRMYDTLATQGRNGHTLWVITGDHGEGLGGHQYRDHGLYIYQEELHVPLIVHLPGLAPRRIPEMVSLVDLAPTFAEWFQWPAQWQTAELPGRSLMPLLAGAQSTLGPRFHFAQRQHRYPHGYTTAWEPDPVYCLMNEQYKYLVHANGQDEFYELAKDPGEQVNRVDVRSFPRLYMEHAARAEFSRLNASAIHVGVPIYTDEYQEHLETLGYL